MSVYADEYNTLTIFEHPRARKPRPCDACGESIPAGVTYHRVKSLFDGRWSSVERCERCEKIYTHLSVRMTEPDEYPDEQLNCGHTYQERWGEEPPLEIAALAFALPGDFKV